MDAVHSVRSLTSELTATIVVIMSGFEDCKALRRHSLCLTFDVRAKSDIRQLARCLDLKIL
jgi:hypothetical protein